MSIAEIDSHPIRGTLDSLSAMSSWEELSDAELIHDQSRTAVRDRILSVVGFIKTLLNTSPSELISPAGLSSLNAGLTAINTELTAFKLDRQVQHLIVANNHLDGSVFPYLWALPYRSEKTEAQWIDAILENAKSRADGWLERLQAEAERLAAMNAKLLESGETLGRQVSSLQETVTLQKAEATAVTAEVRAAYSKLEIEIREANDVQRREYGSDMDMLEVVMKDRGDAVLATLEALRVQAQTIVQIVGNVGVTGNYQKVANAESIQANVWRFATVGFFALSVVLVVFTVVTYAGPADFHIGVIRMFGALLLAAPAYYTSNESARHRTTADRARRVELELASVGPFMSSLPDAMQNSIRERLIEEYFGHEGEAHRAEGVLSPKDFLKTIEKLAGKAIDKEQ